MPKYDLIMPIGSACKTTYNLRQRKLQRESLPFDWIWLPTTEVVAGMLHDKFGNFLLKENLEFKPSNIIDHDIFIDHGCGVEFWHDFPYQTDLDRDYDEIKAKYNRRIKRMYENIHASKRILLFRTVIIKPGHKPEDLYDDEMISDDLLLKQAEKLFALFPGKKVDLVYVNLFLDPHEYKEVRLSDNLLKIEAHTPEKDEWIGNQKLFDQILSPYDLSSQAKIRYWFKNLKFKTRKNLIKFGALLKIKSCQEKKEILKDRFRAD